MSKGSVRAWFIFVGAYLCLSFLAGCDSSETAGRAKVTESKLGDGGKYQTPDEMANKREGPDVGSVALGAPNGTASGGSTELATIIGPDVRDTATENVVEEGGNHESADSFEYEVLDGWLSLGLSEEEVIAHLGEAKKESDYYWSAIALYVQKWRYPEHGMILDMESSKEGGPKVVGAITIAAPSMMTTLKNIGIGAPESIVLQTYDEMVSDEGSVPGRQLVVGSIYGGTIFRLENGKVSRIFIGAAAE